MAARKQRVSLCMIVRDEEQNLTACLAPIASLFDEIIVTDTGSRDRTVEIARQFTSQIFHFPWCDDFSAARNKCLQHATGDWIFWLDADDRVPPAQIAPLRELLEHLNDQPRVFMLNTLLLPSHTHEEARVISHPRLFRRHPQLHWRGRVHEQMTPMFDELGYDICFPSIHIEHVGYQERVVAERKARRKLRLLRMDYAEDPNNPSILFHLGMALYQAGDYPEAKRHLLQLLNMDVVPRHCMLWTYDALIELSHLTGNPAQAAEFAARGLTAFANDEYLLYARAKTSYICKDFGAAVVLLQRAMHAEAREMVFQSPSNLKTKLVPLMLGAAQRVLGNYREAEGALHVVLEAHPGDRDALFNLGLLCLDQGRGTDIVQIIERLLRTAGGAANAKVLAAMWNLRHSHLFEARQVIDDLVATDPNLIRARILRVELLSRLGAPWEDQIRAINDVLRLDPGSLDARNWLCEIRQRQAAQVPAVMAAPLSPTSLVAGR